jgi:prevent-host-death family protein
MMKTVGVFDAKTHLSELIDSGEVVTITKHGKPVALLTPVRQNAADVIVRIRAMRKSGGVTLNESDIVEMTRGGRR